MCKEYKNHARNEIEGGLKVRKILSTILTVSILATTLAGCGGGSTTQATTAAAPAETKAAAETQAPTAGGAEE